MKSTTKERLELCQKANKLHHPGITNWVRAEIHHLIHEGVFQEQQNAKRKYFYRYYKSDLENGFPILLTKEEVSRFEKEQENLKNGSNQQEVQDQSDLESLDRVIGRVVVKDGFPYIELIGVSVAISVVLYILFNLNV